jgi:subtilisin family serine protease
MRTLETGISGAASVARRHPGRAKVLIELAESATPAQLRALSDAGARLTIVAGRPLVYRRFVPAEVTSESVGRVVALPGVVRISHAPDRGPPPLERSAELVRLIDARGARAPLGDLTGKGTLIADMDTMVDPFHPTFYKGDAGYYDWIDVDGDGVFTPGTDAIDLDGDKTATSGETGIALLATTVDSRDQAVAGRAPAFDPGIDWVYLDSNGNGQRDFGSAGHFDDSVPALGEPLFTPDDVNRNGKVDVGERFVRLGTSKFRKIYVNLVYPSPMSALYVRGQNLAETKVDYTGGQAYGYPDALHATGVNTILVGDLPLVGRRWVGMAPEADVVVGWDTDSLPIDSTTWAFAESPNVALYELAPWTGLPLDGSDPLSQLIDEASNITHTCPTGDQGSARKHARATLNAGESSTLVFEIPGTPNTASAFQYVDLSINVQGVTPKALTLTGPHGDVHDVRLNGNAMLGPDIIIDWTTQFTSRGTTFGDVVMYGNGTTKLETGAWQLSITGGATTSVVDAYVSDDRSSWALGVAWRKEIASDSSTIGVPSVADHCIAVNAHPDHLQNAAEPWFDFPYSEYDVTPGYVEQDGEIRAYSPRGPRIDGVMKPDITAPDNPWVATEFIGTSKHPYGSFTVFGGTSGASPHVTGVAALLAQAGVQGDAARNAIRSGAAVDQLTGPVPNPNYGSGRLDAAGALGMKTGGKDFTLMVASSANPRVGDAKLLVTAVGDADATAGLELKWDEGYDGTWETDYAAAAPYAVSQKMPGRYVYKVRARNATGHVAEAIITLDLKEASGCGCRIGAPSTVPLGSVLVLLVGVVLLGWRRTRRVD